MVSVQGEYLANSRLRCMICQTILSGCFFDVGVKKLTTALSNRSSIQPYLVRIPSRVPTGGSRFKFTFLKRWGRQ